MSSGALLLLALIASLAYVVHLVNRMSDLHDIIIWYRRALSDHNVSWEQVELDRFVHYRLEPGLQPGGHYRGSQGTWDTKFVRPEEADEYIRKLKAVPFRKDAA